MPTMPGEPENLFTVNKFEYSDCTFELVKPWWPFMPVGPAGPVAPSNPCAPVSPFAPWMPGKPDGPLSPVKPLSPEKRFEFKICYVRDNNLISQNSVQTAKRKEKRLGTKLFTYEEFITRTDFYYMKFQTGWNIEISKTILSFKEFYASEISQLFLYEFFLEKIGVEKRIKKGWEIEGCC